MSDPEDTAERLQSHLERTYSITVDSLKLLDQNVYSVTITLPTPTKWVARLFDAAYKDFVFSDASLLKACQDNGVGAERLAVDGEHAVTQLDNQCVLVTKFVEGEINSHAGPTLYKVAATLAKLASLPIPQNTAEGGCLHHYGWGLPKVELNVCLKWLDEVKDRIPDNIKQKYDELQSQVTNTNDLNTLPKSLIHSDPVLKNVILDSNASNSPVLIDWAGSGQGPRIFPIAFFIFVAGLKKGGFSEVRIDTIVAGYRSIISKLETNELDCLSDAMSIRLLSFACMRLKHAINSNANITGDEHWWFDKEFTDSISSRAKDAFGMPLKELVARMKAGKS